MLLPKDNKYGKRITASRIQKSLKMGRGCFSYELPEIGSFLYWQKRFEALGSIMELFCSYTYVVLPIIQKVNKLYIAFVVKNHLVSCVELE